MDQSELRRLNHAILTGPSGLDSLQLGFFFGCCWKAQRGKERSHFLPDIDFPQEDEALRCQINGARRTPW
jgi:hypothetical protein